MKRSTLITDKVIDPNLVNVANSRAARYIHDNKPSGVTFDEVRDDILKEFFLRRDAINAAAEAGDVVALGDALEESINAAFSDSSNESHKHIRKLVPYQVRHADRFHEDEVWEDLARDMANYFFRQSRREAEVRYVRCAIRHLAPEDRRIARAYMKLGSWERVARQLNMSEGTFRRQVLLGFIARFKEEWAKCW